MRIGELARSAGTTPRTVRYYEEIGLLPEDGSRAGGRIASTGRTISRDCWRSCA